MPDTVTLVLDAEQYHRELAKITAQNQRLGQSGERIGEGFLKGERAARVATRNIVVGLSQVQDASSAAILTAQGLERVFRIGILPTVAVAAGIALAEVITKIIEKEQKLREEIERLKFVSTIGPDFLGTDQITKNLSDTSAKIAEVSADIAKLRGGFMKFGPIDLMGSETRAFFLEQDEEKLAALRAAAGRDILNLTSKQNDLNRVEMERLDGAQDLADLDKLEIDHKERLGKLADLAVSAGLAQTEAARQLLSVENDRYNIAVAILKKKQEEANLKGSIKTAETVQDFFADVGSGRFAKKFQQQQQQEFEAQAGRQLVDKIQRGQEQGFFQKPLSQAILRDAQKAAQGAKTGLQALVNADFTNLLDLSRYDFTGLTPLNGLTISIQ